MPTLRKTTAHQPGVCDMAQENKPAVEVRVGTSVLDIYQGGQPFAVYNFDNDQAGLYKPYFHPVFGPHGWPITQNGEFPGTYRGHYWHHGIFIGHRMVSHKTDAGAKTSNFWEERIGECGGLAHIGFVQTESGAIGGFQEQILWRSEDGRDVLQEIRTVVVSPLDPARPGRRVMDLLLQFRAPTGLVRFEQTPYNLLACRVINAMCPKAQKESYTKQYGNLTDFRPLTRYGQLVTSEGKVNDEVRGTRARWCDFSGPIDNVNVGGIAILDHPRNPRHPTPWNTLNNMTFMASFTYQEFFELAPEKELRLRYRIVIHPGTAEEAEIEKEWQQFAEQM
jgi:hypothetical protein